ncbi:cytochrome c family protein [Candidatus Magnetoovum chiemensis]|nr:cytochrome c family protein [Candidatus Magnetoovum chiemensis]
MKHILKISLTAALFLALLCGLSYAQDVENGKKLFNDPAFAGGTSGKSCNTCHADGKGLEKAGAEQKITMMGKEYNSLEEAVNACIEGTLKGKPLSPDAKEMKDITAYIKSLGAMKPAH